MNLKSSFISSLYDVIIAPVVTEQSSKLQEIYNQHIFWVKKNATKKEIKLAIESIFSVKVESVNTLIRKGKTRIFKGHSAILQDRKRAFVKLAAGEKIDYISGGE